MRTIVAFFLLVATLSAVESKKSVETVKKEGSDFEFYQIELNIISKTNRERQRFGLSKLNIDKNLMLQARRHARWMARNRVLRHGRDIVAENIAMGQSTSTEAVQDWMNSPGHRSNILGRGHAAIGVAAYKAANGQIYWCQQFGSAL